MPNRRHLKLATAARIVEPGGRVTVLGPRDGVLLAWLALEGPTPRARLAQLLWPESEPEAARNALRQRLFQLKKLLGVDVVSGSATLVLAEGIAHDLAESDSVLGEGAHDFGPELAAWLAQQRERRRGRLRQSMVELSDMAAQARDYADALSHANELLTLEPLSEEAHRRVMQLHYLAGDRASALLAFDRCEQLLKDEVGAKPAAETLVLLAHIEASAQGAVGLQPQMLQASLLRPPRDIGRERERDSLLAAWQAGQPFVLLGEPGIGKSRVLESLALAWPGALVVSARPGDSQVPLALVTRLIEQLRARQPAWLQGELVRDLLPLLTGEPASPPRKSPRPAPRSLAPALQTLLALAAAEQPALALLLDDWQFADDASADLLSEVLASPALQTVRRGHASRTLSGAVAERRVAALRQHSSVRCVTLQPLALGAVSELVATLQVQGVDAAHLAQALVGRVSGNPLHILETLRHMLETQVPLQADRVAAPRQVKELVAARLHHLSDAARQVLRVSAVAGTDFCVELAEVVCGRGALDLWDDWSLLERMGLFDSRGIAHDLYAEAVYDSLPGPIGRVLHGRVAGWLEGQAYEPARLAVHWQAAGDDGRAVPHLLAAGRKAWFASRGLEAFDFYRRAGEIELARGRPDDAFAAWFDNAEVMAEIGSPALVAQCLLALEPLAHTEQQKLRLALVVAVHRHVSGNVEGGFGGMIDLLSEAIAMGDTRVESECRFAIASRAVADGRFDEALQHLAADERLLRQAGEVRRANGLAGTMAMVLGMRGHHRLAIREHERMLPLLQQEGDHATWTVSCSAKALQHIWQGDAVMAYSEVQRAAASAARASIAPPDTIITLRNLIETLRWCGRFDEALRTHDEFMQRLALHGEFPRTREPLVGLYQHLGRVDLARPLLSALLSEPSERVRGRLLVGLFKLQAHFANGQVAQVAQVDWPADAMACDDLALAIQWALWSGLNEISPWPVEDLLALAVRCRKAELNLLEAPLRALIARRLLEAGDTPGAQALLPTGVPADALHGRHAATPWVALFGAQALALAGRAEAAGALARAGAEWLRHTAQFAMPEPFRDSFLHRNPVNRALLALAARAG